MEIVPFQTEHLEAVTALESVIYAGHDPWSRNAFAQELLTSHSLWLVAVDEGGLVAYGGGWVARGKFHLLNLAVASAHRRKGIGQQLMVALMNQAFQRGCEAATLEVRRGNEAARQLYEKLGFRVEGVRRSYYTNGEDAVIYSLERLNGQLC